MSTRIRWEFSLGLFTAPPIPQEYAEFLLLCDGYLYKGIRFFGTRTAQVGREGELPTLYDRNAAYVYRKAGASLPDGCLVLGDRGDRLFLYSAVSNRYQIVNEETMVEEQSFSSFEELFFSVVGKA